MGSVYARGTKLWIRYKGHDGKWTQDATDFRLGDERQARTLLERVERKITAGAELGEKELGLLTVERYATTIWIEERKALKVADWKNDLARLRDHVLPTIGELVLAEVRPRHLVGLFTKLRSRGKLAPKSIYNVYSVLKALFRDAKIGDLIDTTPCELTKTHLGENEDKDPEWRPTARYTRDELEMLVNDERIPFDRRVLYALEGIAGLRHGEAAGLRWRHWQHEPAPLTALMVVTSYNTGRAKKGARNMPVHPALADLLTAWKAYGWQKMMGRAPQETDLVVPRPPEHVTRQRVKANTEGMREKTYSFKRLTGDDLPALGLRHRRGHDFRRTMISLARTDGARADLLERCTHNPRKKERSIDVYSSFEWEPLCNEVAKLRVRITNLVVTHPAPHGMPGALAPETPVILSELATALATSASQPLENNAETMVEAPGVEPLFFRIHENGCERLNADSERETGTDEFKGNKLEAVESGPACERCSNVAKAVEQALRALEQGRLDVAREVLQATLTAMAACRPT